MEGGGREGGGIGERKGREWEIDTGGRKEHVRERE